MELKFLGNGACFYPILHNTSAYFIHDNNLILLDCGETVYERIIEKENLNRFNQIYVVLTHLHADHVGSLGSLLSYCYCILKRKIYVVYPGKNICELLYLQGIVPEFYNYAETMEGLIDGLAVNPIEVQHADSMKCFGYEITCDKTHIYYSGDASDIPNEILEKFLSGKISRLYQDTSTHDSIHPSHMFVGKLEEKIPANRRSDVFCMHLDSECRNDLRLKGFSIAE